MKNLVLVLAAVLCSQAAFAQSDDYDQVVPPYPVPQGEVRIDALQEIKLTESTVLTAYVEKRDRTANVHGLGTNGAEVSCYLGANDVALSNFNVLKTETVGGGTKGVRAYLAPASSITLKFKTSSQGVEQSTQSCNGEPELCEGQSSTYVYRTIIIATDKTGNAWSLNCVAPFSRPVFASDVKINGLKIK